MVDAPGMLDMPDLVEQVFKVTPGGCNIGALIITSTIFGVPYYDYSIVGPKTLF